LPGAAISRASVRPSNAASMVDETFILTASVALRRELDGGLPFGGTNFGYFR
jgi:hypothetical protein